MSRYPHDWSIDALSCRACGVPRLHSDPSSPCVAALVARVTELERHVGSLHKHHAHGYHHGWREATAACVADFEGGRHAPVPVPPPLPPVERERALLALVVLADAERDEAVAALANESGTGEPPGEGWGRNDFDAEHVGVAWYRSENRGDDDVPHHGAVILWVYREHGDPEWTWEVERYDAHGDDYHHEAHGKAATARDGMRAADRAQGRE